MKPADESEKENPGDYYDLKQQAVEDLVTADSSNSPEVSEEELQKYRSHKKFRLPSWLTVALIKFWFSASVCYFFLWGLGGYLQTIIDQLFVLTVGMGIVTDLLTNNAIRFFAVSKGSNDKWMMFSKKSYLSFPGNILYSFVIIFVVYTIYSAVNLLIVRMNGGSVDVAGMGVEPILFGLFCTLTDYLFVGAKNLLKRIIEDAKKKARS